MQSGFCAHRVSLLLPLFPLLGKRRKNLCRLRRPLRMDRRWSRALFCVFPFCREARFSLLHTTTTSTQSVVLSIVATMRKVSRSFPRTPLSRPAPFSPATLYLHPSRCFFKASSSRRLVPRGPYSSLFLLLLLSPCPCCILFIRVIVLRVHIPGEL